MSKDCCFFLAKTAVHLNHHHLSFDFLQKKYDIVYYHNLNGGSTYKFGHDDGNYELLQKRFMLGHIVLIP